MLNEEEVGWRIKFGAVALLSGALVLWAISYPFVAFSLFLSRSASRLLAPAPAPTTKDGRVIAGGECTCSEAAKEARAREGTVRKGEEWLRSVIGSGGSQEH